MSNNPVSELIGAGARVVDVRTEAEYEDGHYPGAINIPVGALPSRLGELEPKEEPVVVYCASGARSAKAARILKTAGFALVANAGGLEDMP